MQEVRFECLTSVELEETEDSRGWVSQPSPCANNGESILLSQLWSH